MTDRLIFTSTSYVSCIITYTVSMCMLYQGTVISRYDTNSNKQGKGWLGLARSILCKYIMNRHEELSKRLSWIKRVDTHHTWRGMHRVVAVLRGTSLGFIGNLLLEDMCKKLMQGTGRKAFTFKPDINA